MLNELENKIRKAIPELMELGVGCEILFDKKIYLIDGKTIIIDDCDSIEIRHLDYNYLYFDEYEIIGKPIQLNHVLEYVDSDYLYDIIGMWNLKSNLLSEQSIELISFVNELKND